ILSERERFGRRGIAALDGELDHDGPERQEHEPVGGEREPAVPGELAERAASDEEVEHERDAQPLGEDRHAEQRPPPRRAEPVDEHENVGRERDPVERPDCGIIERLVDGHAAPRMMALNLSAKWFRSRVTRTWSRAARVSAMMLSA